jgi:Kef-type K+ transport system membrane component KefB
VVITALLGWLLLLAFNFSWLSALFLAVAVTFSSTIVILKLLNDKKDTESVYGRYTIGLMLVQDIIVIMILMGLGITQPAISIGTIMVILIWKGLAAVVILYVVARYLLPKLLDHVAHSGEFLFVFTIAWCFGVAQLVAAVGFSLEIGAITAGLLLGSSRYQPEIASRVKPLRDFFLILFFVILGSQMSLGDWRQIMGPAAALFLFIVVVNPLILFWLFRAAKFTRRNSFLIGIMAGQVSEFGFILLMLGQQSGYLRGQELSIFTLVALLSIIVSSYLITFNEQIYRFFIPFFTLFGHDKHRQRCLVRDVYTVWVFGYHRIGWKVCESLAKAKISFAVVDYNPDIIAKLKKRGVPAFFGDAADVEFLEGLPLSKAKLIVSTIPAPDDQLALISHVRAVTDKTIFIANLYHYDHAPDLYQAGANYVMLPHLLGGEWISAVLKNSPWTEATFRSLRAHQKKEMHLKTEVLGGAE